MNDRSDIGLAAWELPQITSVHNAGHGRYFGEAPNAPAPPRAKSFLASPRGAASVPPSSAAILGRNGRRDDRDFDDLFLVHLRAPADGTDPDQLRPDRPLIRECDGADDRG